jgi:hypothetical protein
MSKVLAVFGVLAGLAGIFVLLTAATVMVQICALLLWVIAAVLIAGASIAEPLEKLTRDLERPAKK